MPEMIANNKKIEIISLKYVKFLILFLWKKHCSIFYKKAYNKGFSIWHEKSAFS